MVEEQLHIMEVEYTRIILGIDPKSPYRLRESRISGELQSRKAKSAASNEA